MEAYNQVEVHLKDGRVLSGRADRIDTGALRGVTMNDIEDKFRDCAASVISNAATEELLDLLGRLDEVPDLARVAHLLQGDAASGIR